MELLRLTLITCAYPQNGLSHLIFADWSCLHCVSGLMMTWLRCGVSGVWLARDRATSAVRRRNRHATATLGLHMLPHCHVATWHSQIEANRMNPLL